MLSGYEREELRQLNAKLLSTARHKEFVYHLLSLPGPTFEKVLGLLPAESLNQLTSALKSRDQWLANRETQLEGKIAEEIARLSKSSKNETSP